MTEVWRRIPGFDDYEASTEGRIRNARTQRVLSPVRLGPKRKQYLGVYAGGGRGGRKHPVHRLVALAFLGEPPSPDAQVCHRDDDTTRNGVANLYWGNRSTNAHDSIRNGTFVVRNGERNGHARLTDQAVAAIKNRLTGNRGEQTRLAREFGVSISTINMIARGKTWRQAA